METTFHQGELFIQKMIGVDHLANRLERGISNELMPIAQQFISNQSMVYISSLDENNSVWISLLVCSGNCVEIIDTATIRLNTSKIISSKDALFFNNIKQNLNIGMLFMELGTRRRFRVNGTLSWDNENQITIAVGQAYGNCPKYIQRRVLNQPEGVSTKSKISEYRGSQLTTAESNIIINADTFFVGSSNKKNHLDASHRGGNKGFVKFIDNNTLKIPDYAGNNMYNTLGNFVEHSNAGFLFIDFENNSTLQLNGKASILFYQDSEGDLEASGDTGRFWTFEIEAWIRRENQHYGNWQFEDFSPFNP